MCVFSELVKRWTSCSMCNGIIGAEGVIVIIYVILGIFLGEQYLAYKENKMQLLL